MKEFAKISALIVVLTIALTLTLGVISYSSTVAYAEENSLYAYVVPSDLAGSEYAEQSAVPVYPMSGGKTALFYLIESYYYPVVETNFTSDIMMLDLAGLSAYVEVADLSTAPARNSSITSDNALPKTILTDGSVQVNGTVVNSAEGWTVKPIGMLGDSFFVQAMKDNVTEYGLVAKSSFTETEIAYHPVAQAERDALVTPTPDETPEEEVESSGKSSVALRIVLIIGIAIPAVIIAILLFKPNRNEKGYDDKREMRKRERDGVDYDRDREYRERDDYDGRRGDYDYERRDRDYRDDYDRDRDYRDRDYRDRDDYRR